MNKVHLDTSFINHCVNSGLPSNQVQNAFQRLGFDPVVGIHGIYELARTFLNPNGMERGKVLFSFVRDLSPSYSLPVRQLYELEILRMRTGAAVIPFLDTMNLIATKSEVNRLAAGIFDSRARKFITDRQNEFSTCHPKVYSEYVEHVKDVKRKFGAPTISLENFDDVMGYFSDRLPELAFLIMKGAINRFEARQMVNSIDNYPALRSGIRANIYLCQICVLNEQVPGKDRVDDFRQVIEASYSDSIIMEDQRFMNSVKRINPNLTIVSLRDFKEAFDGIAT